MHEKQPAKKEEAAPQEDHHTTAADAYTTAADVPLWVQPKLEISSPTDPYEREADYIADSVMRMPSPEVTADNGETLRRVPFFALQRACSCGTCADCQDDLLLQRQIDDSAALEDGSLEDLDFAPNAVVYGSVQRSATGNGDGYAPQSVHDVLGRPGRSMDRATRQNMEARFGTDFDHVRIHTDAAAGHSARDVQARAYTVGDQIVFGPGQYAPQSYEGRRLIAHELTHVIQQTGPMRLARGVIAGRRLYRSRGYTEYKKYLGEKRHKAIEKELRAINSQLITEAPIPGGTGNIFKGLEINSQGIADLFMSTGNIVPGIRLNFVQSGGREKGSSKEISSAPRPGNEGFNKRMAAVDTKINHEILTNNNLVRFIRAANRGKAEPKSSITFGPDIIASSQKPKGDFPPDAKIGEIKPLSQISVGVGTSQVGNYLYGLEQFVRVAHHYLRTRSSIKTEFITEKNMTIPSGLDYEDFDTQHRITGQGAIIERKKGKTPQQRIWVFKLRDGLYVYFPLQHPYMDTTFPKDVDRRILDLEGVLDGLRKRQVTLPRQLSPKRLPSATPRPIVQKVPGRSERLQRAPKKSRASTKSTKKTRDWRALEQAWQDKRSDWAYGKGSYKVAGGAREFLTDEADPHMDRLKIDKKLGIKSRPGQLGKIDKKLKKIKFWSGPIGQIYGNLRFRFGKIFEKIETLIHKAKAKFSQLREKAKSTASKIRFGWKKKVINLVVKFAKVGFRALLASTFARITACINEIMDKALGKLVDEASESMGKEMEGHLEKFESFRTELEKKYESEIKKVAQFTETVDKVMDTARILSDIETAVRIGVQIVSCGTPPGLGCLWGLVAQLGISAALELLVDTDYFDKNIGRPAANRLLATVMSDTFMDLVMTALPDELREYTSGVAGCTPPPRRSGTNFNIEKGTFDPNAPDVVKIRKKFEAANRDQLIKEIKDGLQKNGKPVSTSDIKKLIDQMKKSGKKAEDFEKMFKKHKKDKKYSFDGISADLSGAVAEAESGD